MVWYYAAQFIIVILATLIYASMWQKHFDVNLSLMFFVGVISNFGYYTLSISSNVQEALLANKIAYLGGCFGPLFIMLLIFNLCHINIPPIVRKLLFLATSFVYLIVIFAGHSKVFYKEVVFEKVGGATWISKTYGPAHASFTILLLVYTTISFCVLIYSYAKKRDASRYMISLLFAIEIITVALYVARRVAGWRIETVPMTYALTEIIFLLIVYKINIYDISYAAIDSFIEKGKTGFVSIDFKYNYLGSNETAKKYLPQLEVLTVDRSIRRNAEFGELATKWIKLFDETNAKNKHHYEGLDGKIYLITINYLYDGRKKRGYQLFIVDDTKEQKFINLMNSFNAKLSSEVKAKTRHIEAMHDKLIIGMADMVEGRDNSTGGHIKRTSEGVRILLEEIKKDNVYDLSPTFCRNLVKSAPMHDLGKIAVDDVILRKKGKFEPEEYEQMKKHAAEGAKLVDQILDGTDNDSFKTMATNVAHYHHERWDGSGYPEGLVGESIPVEARIMAIADVYDALVSKRVYKDKFSFEKANEIILEGMGSQFDKKLERAYVNARPALEAYYSSLEDEEITH